MKDAKTRWEISKNILNCDCGVILDLGFTKYEKRRKFKLLAEVHNTEIQVHYLKAPHALRRKRVSDRNDQLGDTFSFKVTTEMFDFMEREFQPPTENELMKAIIIDTSSNK